MKSLLSRLSGVAPFFFFPLLIIFRKRRTLTYTLLVLIAIGLSSCYLNFYRTNTKSSIDANTASRLQSENKYFIVHFPTVISELTQVSVKDDTLYGKVVPLTTAHSKYLYPTTTSGKNRVRYVDKKTALMEVHLYTAAQPALNDSLLAISLSSFNRADVYELNKQATTSNHIISTVGMLLTAVIIVATVAASATPAVPVPSPSDPCNCPQVYIENNGAYNFTSGLYSGAVYSTLERMDYLPLTTIPADAKDISFKIANAKNEEQFINTVQLLQVNHSKDVNVLTDRHGNIFSYQQVQSPATAATDEMTDIKNVLSQTDEQYYSFDNKANNEGFSDVILSFNKPANTNEAKLIVHARNTQWGGLLHTEFIGMFGDKYDSWRAKQEKADPKKLEKWQREQALPLMVYIKTNQGWKFIDYFPMIGNTATRDMLMNINTSDVQGNKVEIKLEAAYRLWDLDLAGIDYSANESFTKNIIEPQQAIKSDSTDERVTLRANDKAYTHLTDDEFISFRYAVPSATENNASSYFLVSGGYYHSLESITGKTDYRNLYKLKKKGAFDKLSREKYRQTRDIAAIMENSGR